jgi:hypothetical protein
MRQPIRTVYIQKVRVSNERAVVRPCEKGLACGEWAQQPSHLSQASQAWHMPARDVRL